MESPLAGKTTFLRALARGLLLSFVQAFGLALWLALFAGMGLVLIAQCQPRSGDAVRLSLQTTPVPRTTQIVPPDSTSGQGVSEAAVRALPIVDLSDKEANCPLYEELRENTSYDGKPQGKIMYIRVTCQGKGRETTYYIQAQERSFAVRVPLPVQAPTPVPTPSSR